MLTRSELHARAPDLEDPGITGAARWYDAQAFNSERLVLSFVMSARTRGAQAFNYAKVEDVLVERSRACGVAVSDQLSGERLEIRGRAVADCTGPWAFGRPRFQDIVRTVRAQGLARAMNIVTQKRVAECALGFKPAVHTATDRGSRLLFVAPWRGGSIFGTWYFEGGGAPDALEPSECEVAIALGQVNSVFPSLALRQEEISFVHLGMLPVDSPAGRAGEPQLRTKDDVLCAAKYGGPCGLYWVQGIKYTTARQAAVSALEEIASGLGQALDPSISATTPLYGGDIEDLRGYMESQVSRYKSRYSLELLTRLFKNYGSNMGRILADTESKPSAGDLVPGTDQALQAEIEFVVENEFPQHLSDLILRRTDLGSFALPAVETVEFCAERMGEQRGWDSRQLKEQIADLLVDYPPWIAPPAGQTPQAVVGGELLRI